MSVLLRTLVHLRARLGLDGIWLSPPPSLSGGDGSNLDATHRAPDGAGESHTLLSFQRPPRPRGGVSTLSRDAPEAIEKASREEAWSCRCALAPTLGPGALRAGRVKGLQGDYEYSAQMGAGGGRERGPASPLRTPAGSA